MAWVRKLIVSVATQCAPMCNRIFCIWSDNGVKIRYVPIYRYHIAMVELLGLYYNIVQASHCLFSLVWSPSRVYY